MELNQEGVAYRKELDYTELEVMELPPFEELPPVKLDEDVDRLFRWAAALRRPQEKMAPCGLSSIIRTISVLENMKDLARACFLKVTLEYWWDGEYRITLFVNYPLEIFCNQREAGCLVRAIQHADRFMINPLDEQTYELVFRIWLFRPQLPETFSEF